MCQQSFAVEDEEDGSEVINYAIQEPVSDHTTGRLDELNESSPPPLPDSSPPMYNSDSRLKKDHSGDGHSLGGSSYDKVRKRKLPF